MKPSTLSPSGFTLLEIIITLTVGALLMAVVLPYLGTTVTRSSEPLSNLRTTLALHQTMENMTAEHKRKQAEAAPKSEECLALTAMKGDIGKEGTDWINGVNEFGNYHVLENGFITFDETTGQEVKLPVDEVSNILKVTIRPVNFGATFTTLFTCKLEEEESAGN